MAISGTKLRDSLMLNIMYRLGVRSLSQIHYGPTPTHSLSALLPSRFYRRYLIDSVLLGNNFIMQYFFYSGTFGSCTSFFISENKIL